MKSNTDKKITALEYACMACDTIMSKFAPEDLPPKGVFHYHQGVFLTGVEKISLYKNKKKYKDYIRNWVDSIIECDGNINTYDNTRLDDIQPSVLLFNLYKDTKKDKYIIALNNFIQLVEYWYKTDEGGFWHKKCHPNQMWLDGIYMVCPFISMYALHMDRIELFDIARLQINLMYQHMYDKNSGLMYHAYDHTKKEIWSDMETGCSPCFWGRAIGWYLAGIIDMLDYIPDTYNGKKEIIDILNNLLSSLVKYQNKTTGLWYQIVNRVDDKDNWLELSSSSLFVYSLLKAIRKGYISNKYKYAAEAGYNGVVKSIRIKDDNTIILPQICVGTGVGDYEFYINRPVTENDLHGVGGFLHMCSEHIILES